MIFYFATRIHVGKNVCAAKSINRLFRIANQQQPRVRLLGALCLNINRLEDAILLGIGILEFIDHRHGITLADRLSQHLTTGLL